MFVLFGSREAGCCSAALNYNVWQCANAMHTHVRDSVTHCIDVTVLLSLLHSFQKMCSSQETKVTRKWKNSNGTCVCVRGGGVGEWVGICICVCIHVNTWMHNVYIRVYRIMHMRVMLYQTHTLFCNHW